MRPLHRRPQKGCEGEQRPGNRLRGTVPGQKGFVTDPAASDYFGLEQWQHDVTATEYQRSGAVKRIEHAQGWVRPQLGQQGQAKQ
ncbi:hypothetical protein D3C81_1522120 [compost metagenome]